MNGIWQKYPQDLSKQIEEAFVLNLETYTLKNVYAKHVIDFENMIDKNVNIQQILKISMILN